MLSMQSLQHEHLVCQCSDFRHDIRFTFDPHDGDIWLDVNLVAVDPWYKRILTAIKYVFGKDRAYGDYDCTLLRIEDYAKLRTLFDKSEEASKTHLETYRSPEKNKQ